MDLSPLRHELTIGLNRIYLLFPVARLHDDLSGVRSILMSSANGKRTFSRCRSQSFSAGPEETSFRPATDIALLYSENSRENFTADIAAGLWEGGTVTYVALQLAFFMGFHDVVLIGVDHSFQTSGPAHKLVTSDGSDPDHFHPDYFGKGVQWQLPDLEMSERAYRLAERAYAAAGRRVRNATLGGRLKVFPLADYRAVLDEPRPVGGAS